MDVVQTKRLVALFAVEMDVTVVLLIMIWTLAQLITRASRAIVDYVNYMVVTEQRQSAEDS